MKFGTLYCIGTGPGDPELLTLKGARLLQSAPVVFVPRQSGSGRSQAFDIVRPLVDETRQKVIGLVFPMVRETETLETAWDVATSTIVQTLEAGLDAALPVLGDPLLYGTFNYLLKRLASNHPHLQIKVVPGVTSIQAASAAGLAPLVEGGERLAVLPAIYEESPESLERALAEYDTVVFLKVGSALGRVLPLLKKSGRLAKSMYAERLGLEGQRIIKGEAIAALEGETLPYFSLLLVKK